MKKQYRIIFALSVTAIFVVGVGVAFGATNLTNNITDVNETNENETNATEIAIEAANFTPVVTIVDTPVETTIAPTIPVSTPKQSPGFGIVAAIVVVLSAIYIRGKRR
jgi:PGF-CTERM protein